VQRDRQREAEADGGGLVGGEEDGDALCVCVCVCVCVCACVCVCVCVSVGGGFCFGGLRVVVVEVFVRGRGWGPLVGLWEGWDEAIGGDVSALQAVGPALAVCSTASEDGPPAAAHALGAHRGSCAARCPAR